MTALDTLLERLQWGILGVGGLGTLLAAIGFDLWVALTTAVAAALATYLSYRGVDSTLTTSAPRKPSNTNARMPVHCSSNSRG